MTQVIADRYRLDDRLAFINHSEFYDGFDLQTQQRVIVRLVDLHQEEQKFLSKLERFMANELRILQQLAPLSMLQILDYGLHETTYYQINEFVDFRTLRDEITRTPCDLKTALQYGRDLATILAQTHKANIIHCDIKPDTVLVTAQGLKLMEFFVANHTVPDGVITGTPAYLSPDAIGAVYPISTTRDVWSFGILLYELIAGAVPYATPVEPDGGENKGQLLMRIVIEPAPSLEDAVPNLPPRLVSLMHGMLEKDPNKRIADMGYVAQELEAILSEFFLY